MTMFAGIILILVMAALATILTVALIKFSQMSRPRYEQTLKKAEQFESDGDLAKAEKTLQQALTNIGWNYAGLLAARQSGRLIGIEGASSVWFSIARATRVLPRVTIGWALPAFMSLGRIFEKTDRTEMAYKLYDDLASFLEGYKDDIRRFNFHEALIELLKRRSKIDLAKDNPLSAILNHAAQILHEVELSRFSRFEDEVKNPYPYQGRPELDAILEAMDRTKAKGAVIEMINRSVNEEMGRVHFNRVERDLTNLLAGRRTFSDMEQEAAKEMLKGIIQKATSEPPPKEEKKEEQEEEQEEKKDVILL
jgi:hypothetical protein